MVDVIKASELDKYLKEHKDKIVLVDVYADWCGPCKALTPILEELVEEHEDWVVVKVNLDDGDNKNFAKDNRIMSIPTVMIYRDGELVDRIVGSTPKDDYEKAIQQVLEEK